MMHFIDTVQVFSTTGKSAKGQALQKMAQRFGRVLIQGEDAPAYIVVAMRERAKAIDEEIGTRKQTYIDLAVDETNRSFVIQAFPVSDTVEFDQQPYFRIYGHEVARTATIAEATALATEEGGEQ